MKSIETTKPLASNLSSPLNSYELSRLLNLYERLPPRPLREGLMCCLAERITGDLTLEVLFPRQR